MTPVPTPEILWRSRPCSRSPLFGRALGHLGEPSTASSAAWAAAGTAVRTLHAAPVPPWQVGPSTSSRQARRRVRVARLQRHPSHRGGHAQPPARRDCAPAVTPVFIHGDLQVDHVFVAGTRSPASSTGRGVPGRRALRPRHPHARTRGAPWRRRRGYGTNVDRDLIRAWWSLRCCLTSAGWSSTASPARGDARSRHPEIVAVRRRGPRLRVPDPGRQRARRSAN